MDSEIECIKRIYKRLIMTNRFQIRIQRPQKHVGVNIRYVFKQVIHIQREGFEIIFSFFLQQRFSTLNYLSESLQLFSEKWRVMEHILQF